MPAQRKRKQTAVEDQQSSKQIKSAKIQKGIHSFSSVGKRREVDGESKKQKISQQCERPPPSIQGASTKGANKRTREAVSDSEEEIVVAPRASIVQQERNANIYSTPRSKRIKHVAPPTPTDTPTKGTLALFDRLKIDGNSRAIPCALQKQDASYDTPPRTPIIEDRELSFTLPDELKDLQALHASFLASLSIYYSHNGSTSPVSVMALLPMITKHWQKRGVQLDDLRRLLAVGEKQEGEFSLQDYGRAGICICRTQANERTSYRAASFIDEEKLNSRFESLLLKAWTSWQASTAQENGYTTAFLDQMPLTEISVNESVQKAAPLFARGQQRLADLKASKSEAKHSSAQTISVQPVCQQSAQATQNRGTALLDRILAKQSMASNLPAGPTKEQLERKSALHRVEDVTRVLSLLAGPKERCSFSMQAIVQHLQQSLKNPISKDEVQRCLGLISTEIVPGFIKVVQSGEVKGVVIAKSANVGLAELKARVERACA